MDNMLSQEEALEHWKQGVFQAKLLVEKLEQPETFSYYVEKSRSYEIATRWVKAWAEIHNKYQKNGGHIERFKKVRIKGQKAWERLVSLL